jgi:hypothetical protein
MAESIDRRIEVQACPGKMQEPIPKITKAKRSGDIAQGVENQPSKWEALSSNSSTTKKLMNKQYILAFFLKAQVLYSVTATSLLRALGTKLIALLRLEV